VPQADAGLEVADAQLDDGVAAVILVEFDGGADPVGDQGVVAPVGEQLGLGADQAGAHDQPVAPVAGLGDLGDATVGVDDLDPGGLVDARDRLPDRLGLADGDGVADPVAPAGRMVPCDQNPESMRMVSSPDAPARRTRAASSSTKRAVPRAVLARPVRWRACSTSPLSARVATSGW
jgi:hypothetical protein